MGTGQEGQWLIDGSRMQSGRDTNPCCVSVQQVTVDSRNALYEYFTKPEERTLKVFFLTMKQW